MATLTNGRKHLEDKANGTYANATLGKDETELRLEKAIFGDAAGFLDSLTRPGSPGRSDLILRGDGDVGDGDEDGDEGSDENLSDVPDEDV